MDISDSGCVLRTNPFADISAFIAAAIAVGTDNFQPLPL